jgi:glucosylceramidase
MMKTIPIPSLRLLALLCLAAGMAACGRAAGSGDKPDGKTEPTADADVQVLVSTADRSLDLARQTIAFAAHDNMSPATVVLQPDVRYQTMDGFGAAITGSSAYNLLRMAAADRADFLRRTFAPGAEGFGWSYVRIAIGCSDFSLSEYTCCDTPGIEHFALTTEETDYVIPILRQIQAVNPGVKVIASPWTCPRWMKVNNLVDRQPHNEWTGGQLNPACYADYARYFVSWIEAFRTAGIAIHAVTVQNEPLNRGNSASLFMGWQEQADFVTHHLVPALRAARLETKIYLFDHNYNYDDMADQNDYPLHIYRTPGGDDPLIAGAAYHNYGGSRAELLNIRAQAPDRELIFTETSIGTWNDGRNLAVRLTDDMQEVALGTVAGGCKAVIVWNLMLDSNRGPNRPGGCQTCYGAVDIGADYKTITRNSHYYIISHLAAVVRPGAVRIGTTGHTAAETAYAAFANPDGTYAFVLLNSSTEARTLVVDDGTRHFVCTLPPRAVGSYLWTKQPA